MLSDVLSREVIGVVHVGVLQVVEASGSELRLIEGDPSKSLLIDGHIHIHDEPAEEATTEQEAVEVISPLHDAVCRPTHESQLSRVVPITTLGLPGRGGVTAEGSTQDEAH